METSSKNWFSRHKILSIILAVIILGAVGASLSSSSDKKTESKPTTNTNQSSSADTSIPKIGQAARDGKFEFVVNKQTCGKTSVGDQYLNKKAQGQFCILNIAVKNIGNEPQTFDASNQYIFNSQNQKYAADSTASTYENSNTETFLNSINPGNSVIGNVVFDVPKDITPVTAELHDSVFSGGVKVSLK